MFGRGNFKTVEYMPVLRKQLSLLELFLLKRNFSKGVLWAKSHSLVTSFGKDSGLFKRKKPKLKEFAAPPKNCLGKNCLPGSHPAADTSKGTGL